MSNMSYCRFQNTLKDLKDCVDSFTQINSKEEFRAMLELIQICNHICQDEEITRIESMSSFEEYQDIYDDSDDDF